MRKRHKNSKEKWKNSKKQAKDKFNKKKIKTIIKKVLKRIKPSSKDMKNNEKIIKEVSERLMEATPSDVEVVLVGSAAKGTYIKHKKDFDVFLLFPKKYSMSELENIGLEAAKAAFSGYKWKIAYAAHPYIKVEYKRMKIDIVPAYRILNINERATAVDRSPLHTQYINSHLTAKQKDDVRLLKQFMRAHGIYGAELRVEGFSGYLCELLIVKYGSFINTLRSACNWNIPTVIDIEGYYNDHGEILAIYDAPLIVIDPVDKNRNVAAVVSTTSMSKFIFFSRKFLEKPMIKHFFNQETRVSNNLLISKINSRHTTIFTIEFNAPDGIVEDTLWPQLRKMSRIVVDYLKREGFGIIGYYYWTDMIKCIFFIELHSDKIPAVKHIIGPKITFKEGVDRFIDKHKDMIDLYIEHDHIAAMERVNKRTVKEVFDICIRKKNIGLPKNLSTFINRYKRLSVNKLVKNYKQAVIEYFLPSIKL